jgi:acyl dehydratase
MVEIRDPAALRALIGQEIAVGDWVDVSQARINQFAETTEDRQWIHVDAARAARDSPFKATIAHGFLTLSLVSVLTRAAVTFVGVRMAINYGLNRVRFVSPVPSGSRIRGRFSPLAVEDVSDDGVQVTWGVTVERDGGDKPACVVEWLVRYYR